MQYFKPLFLFVTFVIMAAAGFGQELKPDSFDVKLFLDSLKLWANSQNYQPAYDYLHLNHSPGEQDKRNLKRYGYLLTQKPTTRNYKNYYKLACSLWELNKLNDAELLFLNIINSSEKHYTATYNHASDISGDTSVNIYGYGSYTSSYKNNAAIYLAKIYITNKQFDKALLFVEDAVKRYPVTYTCGTGFYNQKEEYDFLYASCYDGLKKYDEALELLLPGCLGRNDAFIIRAIKNKYSQAEIMDSLQKSEASMQCLFDTFPSISYRKHYDNGKLVKTDTLTTYAGSARIELFGKTVGLSYPGLEDGEKATRELFIKSFKESAFYKALNPPAKQE